MVTGNLMKLAGNSDHGCLLVPQVRRLELGPREVFPKDV